MFCLSQNIPGYIFGGGGGGGVYFGLLYRQGQGNLRILQVFQVLQV